MSSYEVSKKIKSATKWSIVTELFAKLLTPISSVILARILMPEAYGIVATMTMVIAFCNLFSDAGFQKYLLQASFRDKVDRNKSIDVAFWTNLIISVVLFFLVFLFQKSICKFIGAEGFELPLVISCLIIPVSSFSSLQKALFKRDLDFKTLFVAKMLATLIPLFITIPLAFYTKDFWALIIGGLALNLINSIYLTIKSPWKPSFYFDFLRLKQMFSFGIWVTVESILAWTSSYLDIFLIGTYLSSFYLGLYKTSIVFVSQIFSLIISAVIPVLTPSLSKFKNNKKEFDILFFKYQKTLSMVSLPIGVIIFMNSSLFTDIILGDQWIEAANFIGVWSLMNGFTLLIIQFKSAAIIAKGKPKFLVFGQVLYLIIFIPVIFFSVRKGFEFLYLVRTLIRLVPVIISLYLIFKVVKINALALFYNVVPSMVSSIAIMFFFCLFKMFELSYVWEFISIIVSVFIYTSVLSLFKKERFLIKQFFTNVLLIKIKKWI